MTVIWQIDVSFDDSLRNASILSIGRVETGVGVYLGLVVECWPFVGT